MEESLRSRLRDELKGLFGPRRFHPGPSHRGHLVTARPQTVAEVQQLALLTRDAKVPIIMRGGMSSPFAGGKATEVFLDRSAIPETNAGAVHALLALAKSVGGASYANGMSLEEGTISSTDRVTDIAAFRRTVDPDNRLNPRRVVS